MLVTYTHHFICRLNTHDSPDNSGDEKCSTPENIPNSLKDDFCENFDVIKNDGSPKKRRVSNDRGVSRKTAVTWSRSNNIAAPKNSCISPKNTTVSPKHSRTSKNSGYSAKNSVTTKLLLRNSGSKHLLLCSPYALLV